MLFSRCKLITIGAAIMVLLSTLVLPATVLAQNNVVVPNIVVPLLLNASATSNLTMFILLDRSGSMNGENWDAATAGLSEFFNADSSAGITVGMNFFPVQGVGPGDSDQCLPSIYDPIQVPLGELPTRSEALIRGLTKRTPEGLTTPTYPAMEGTMIAAVDVKASNLQRNVIVILISDGSPSQCNTNIDQIVSLASAGAALGIRTYTISLLGIGSGILLMDAIASAGNTGLSYDVSNNVSLFKTTLEEIRTDADL